MPNADFIAAIERKILRPPSGCGFRISDCPPISSFCFPFFPICHLPTPISELPSSSNVQNTDAVASLNNPPSNQNATNIVTAPARQATFIEFKVPRLKSKVAHASCLFAISDFRLPICRRASAFRFPLSAFFQIRSPMPNCKATYTMKQNSAGMPVCVPSIK